MQLKPEQVNFVPDFDYDHSLSKPCGSLTFSGGENFDEDQLDEDQCYEDCVNYIKDLNKISTDDSRNKYKNLTLDNVLMFINDNQSFFVSIIQGSYSKSWRHKLFVHLINSSTITQLKHDLDTVLGLYSLVKSNHFESGPSNRKTIIDHFVSILGSTFPKYKKTLSISAQAQLNGSYVHCVLLPELTIKLCETYLQLTYDQAEFYKSHKQKLAYDKRLKLK